VRPYVGGGASLIAINVDAEGSGAGGSASISDDDVGVGLYLHGGAAWQVASSFRLGLDLRYLTGTDVDLFGVNGDVDYAQAALFLGFGH
jgi:opacity protein-like surface antigen